MSANNRKKRRNNADRVSNYNNPRAFFKSIGIRPSAVYEPEIPRRGVNAGLSEALGHDIVNYVMELSEGLEKWKADDCHGHTNLAEFKQWYGNDIDRLCRIASRIKRLGISPGSSILDLGGGPGHLAFWMAHIWPGCNVTVADRWQQAGAQWAREIGEERVTFVDALLPDLSPLKGERFDVIILSRVLGSTEDLKLESHKNRSSSEEYFESDDAKRVLSRLEEYAAALNNHLKKDGIVAVIDSWSSFRVLIIGKAFANGGLHINFDRFPFAEVGMNYSTIVFSKEIECMPCHDIPLAFSTYIDLKVTSMKQIVIFGNAAEFLRKSFNGSRIIHQSRFKTKDSEREFMAEILDSGGLSLIYISGTACSSTAIMGTSLAMTDMIKYLEGLKEMFINM